MEDIDKTAILLACELHCVDVAYNKRSGLYAAKLPSDNTFTFLGSSSTMKESVFEGNMRFRKDLMSEQEALQKWYRTMVWIDRLKYSKLRTFTFYLHDEIGLVRIRDSATDNSIWFI